MIMSLAEAVRQDKLADFISQEEARDMGPTDDAEFLAVLKEAAKVPQSEKPVSDSPCDDGLTGK